MSVINSEQILAQQLAATYFVELIDSGGPWCSCRHPASHRVPFTLSSTLRYAQVNPLRYSSIAHVDQLVNYIQDFTTHFTIATALLNSLSLDHRSNLFRFAYSVGMPVWQFAEAAALVMVDREQCCDRSKCAALLTRVVQAAYQQPAFTAPDPTTSTTV